MRQGFYVFTDSQGRLLCGIADGEQVWWLEPLDIVDSLSAFIWHDFTDYWKLIDSLYELSIFDPVLDVSFEDLEECAEICRAMAEGLPNPIDAYFTCAELDRIAQRKDDGTASFWLYQARDMVAALRIVVEAHTFISRAFDICFDAEGVSSPWQRAEALFAVYPDLEEHTFQESFVLLPLADGGLSWELLQRGQGDRPDCALVYGRVIRTHKEFLFFCLLELLCKNVRVQRCQCCDGFFVPRTKKKTLYCDRAIKGGRTCKEVAPKLKQRLSRDSDPALREYDRLYKMYYARAERYEGRLDLDREKTENDLTMDEFYMWSARAAALRQQYMAGGLSAVQLMEQLIF